jgi:prepilin-type N-terminal cleavage/methylation domain-containing protein
MQGREGFTLLELMVVVVIVGVLGASAVPLYRTWQQRAYGSEAAIMAKQILDAEIMYYLDHDEFYPPIGEDKDVLHGDPNDTDIADIRDNLNIKIPAEHFLDYYLVSYYDDNNILSLHLSISSLDQQFDIFRGVSYIAYKMDKDGNIESTQFREY